MNCGRALICLLPLAFLGGCEERINVDPCLGVTCSGHGHCVLQDGQPACWCDTGYEPDGLNCIDLSNPVQTCDQVAQ